MILSYRHRASTCARIVSVSGSQNVMSIDVYISIAVDSSARASSHWPVAAYSLPRPRWQCAWSGPYPQLLGQGEGLMVVGSGLVNVRGSAMRGDLAEEPEGISFVAQFLAVCSRAKMVAKGTSRPPSSLRLCRR